MLDQNNIPSEDPSQGEQPFEPVQVPFIDLVENDDDDNDDDVVESSPRSFYQARANARRSAINLSLGNNF
ncbi:hypothetical protein TSUD_12830 [Trifolium subterraneum]|uniref:Uncharacterized protein n=1 Tax=Trifolium subterraneum TaxID=3900 RepID=A0A2Z6NEG4_TRISU|nr:hypothetical protein TSUD_12830 [Trifolium subterraneum]